MGVFGTPGGPTVRLAPVTAVAITLFVFSAALVIVGIFLLYIEESFTIMGFITVSAEVISNGFTRSTDTHDAGMKVALFLVLSILSS
jgi:hypothetical protein